MSQVRLPACLAMAIALMNDAVFAQAPTNVPISAATNTPPDADEQAWSFSASASTYLVPDDRNYVQPTFTADRGWLHLEARYNYAALDTGSAWVGYNFSGGETVEWEFTPMIGGVFGDTAGIAPGYKGSLSWLKLEVYSEGEYVFDARSNSDSFFYNWSEVTLAPAEWFRFGLVTQRTRVYNTDREIQRGVLAGFSFKSVSLTGHVFNPDDSKPIFVLAVALLSEIVRRPRGASMMSVPFTSTTTVQIARTHAGAVPSLTLTMTALEERSVDSSRSCSDGLHLCARRAKLVADDVCAYGVEAHLTHHEIGDWLKISLVDS